MDQSPSFAQECSVQLDKRSSICNLESKEQRILLCFYIQLEGETWAILMCFVPSGKNKPFCESPFEGVVSSAGMLSPCFFYFHFNSCFPLPTSSTLSLSFFPQTHPLAAMSVTVYPRRGVEKSLKTVCIGNFLLVMFLFLSYKLSEGGKSP